MTTPIDELSVRITGHPEGDPEPASVTSGWARTTRGRRELDRARLRESLIAAAGLAGTPHVLGEQFTETTWEAPAAALEIDIAVRVDVLGEDGPAGALAEAVTELVGEETIAFAENEAVDLVRWQLAVVLDHPPEQIEIERLEQDGTGWVGRVLAHLGAFDCEVAADGGVTFRRVPRFS